MIDLNAAYHVGWSFDKAKKEAKFNININALKVSSDLKSVHIIVSKF